MQGVLFLVSLLFANAYCHATASGNLPLKKKYASKYNFIDYYGGFKQRGISPIYPLGHGLHVTTVELNGSKGVYEEGVDALIHYKLFGAASELEHQLFEDMVFYIKVADAHERAGKRVDCKGPTITLKIVKCNVDSTGKATIEKVYTESTHNFRYNGRYDTVVIGFRKLFNGHRVPMDEVYALLTTKNKCYYKLAVELLEPDSINP